jgi:N-acetylmuramoyl-L-alanine amidase
MRVVLALLLFCFAAALASHAAEPDTYRHTRLNNQDYVSLKQWVDRGKFEVFWTKKDEELRIQNTASRLSLRVNSTRAELNGITVFLSFPVLQHGGTVFVSLTDIRLLLDPLLRPRQEEGRVRTIALCAGHGGRDAGFKLGAHQEKDYTLLLAQEVQTLLQEAGYQVVMIRSADQYLSLEERPVRARQQRADLYLSLHYNSAAASSNNAARGVEVYCLPPAQAQSTMGRTNDFGAALSGNRFDQKNILLAYQIQKSLVNGLSAVDRGVRRARFSVLRNVEMPAVLIEAGFMSHPEELTQIMDPVHRRKTALAIVEGVKHYCQLVEHDSQTRTAHRNF